MLLAAAASSTMACYTMAGMFDQGEVRNPSARPMEGAKYIHVVEDNGGNKHGNWVDGEGRSASEREKHKKQVLFMANAGNSKYTADTDFLDCYKLSNEKCDNLHAESTKNETSITKDKGLIAGYRSVAKAGEYRRMGQPIGQAIKV